jgi:hypothetical protein
MQTPTCAVERSAGDAMNGRPERVAAQRRPHRGSGAALLWLLGALVVLTLVVGGVAGGLRAPAEVDPVSPEGTVQAWLQAVFEERFADAHGHLAEQTAERCPVAAFRQAWVPESPTAALEDVHTTAGEAEVTVQIRSVAGPGPFGAGTYASREVFTLVEYAGTWRLTGVPWPLLDCRGW